MTATGGYSRTRGLFLRALGVVFFAAFASWYVQQDGLIGSRGIMPAATQLGRIREQLGGPSFWQAPTLLWWSISDGALGAVAIAGLVSSALLVLGILPLLSLLSCWLLYLSLVMVGGVFMQFQWDSLLLEAGFTSLLLCPLALRLGPANREPHPIALFLIRWLLFRLMVLSGWVKLASHDDTWRDLTALTWHYWTQPLPTWSAWYVDGLPAALHKFSAAAMFLVELACPLFLFAPRVLRLWGALVPISLLMLVIAATGNYGFFNLLTLVLCLPLLDDRALHRLRLAGPAAAAPSLGGPLAWARSAVMVGAGLLILSVSVGEIGIRMLRAELPAWQSHLIDAARPFRSINTYGLFATMTTERHEISVEGSSDGATWHEYRFQWKPGPLGARPRFMTPHMPRLDWQMWFAALGTCEHNTWFLLFQQRLLEGSAPVVSLLADNPFPNAPPRFVRTPLYDYRFSDHAAMQHDGAWWTRRPIGDYCPPLTLKAGRITRAELPR